jgi:hypothetical protein
MSLKFGIYLVEQRIISPEQFCGLVKIQQDSLKTLASISIQTNLLTIRQVAGVLDVQEHHPEKSFGDIVLETKLLDRAALNQLLHAQQKTCPSIRQLLVECGLLTNRQTRVLFTHFERNAARNSSRDEISTTAPAAPQAAPAKPRQSTAPRQPKFHSRSTAASSQTVN